MLVAKLEPDAFLPTVKYVSDAGMDFYSLEDYVIKPQTFQICRTGIAVQMPLGCTGQIWPKSRNNWLIGGGIVDENYRGEILFKIFNVLNYDIVIRRGDPLGQMVFVFNLNPEYVEEISLEEYNGTKTERGATGGIVTELLGWPQFDAISAMELDQMKKGNL